MERQAITKVQRKPSVINHLQRQSARSAPATHSLLKLQRSVGNQAVQRLLASPYIQTKLNVSTPGDPSEQEADRVADTVMRMPQPAAQVTPPMSANIGTPPSGGGSPLPPATRAFFEPRFGTDFGHVRVHADACAADAAKSVHAKAFTVGQNITFGEGQYAPESREGRRLIAHELTHLVQQSGAGMIHADQSNSKRTSGLVQRTVGDGHDLSSPRFRGETLLEACLDDEARLGVGASGPAVFKVQQALIDLGFDLGAKGADGVFGPLTANAIKSFKARERLGFETIGDVGPGTMRRLDELFPAEAFEVPVDTAEEEGGLSCSTDEEIVTAGQQQGAISDKLALTGEAEPGGGSRAAPVSIDETVRRFKQKVNVVNAPGRHNLSESGQFFWGRQVALQTDAELTSIAFEPGGREFANKGRELILMIANRSTNPLIGPKLAELDNMADGARGAVKPRMLAVLKGTQLAAGGILQGLWAALEGRPDDTIPSVQNLASIRVFLKMRQFEKSDCFNHAERVARRLLRKGGIIPVAPGAPQMSQVIGTHNFVSDFRPILFPVTLDKAAVDQAVDPTGDSLFMMGHVMKQTNVASAVSRMKQALDGGRLVHARVFSGVGFGGSLGPVQRGGKRQELRLLDKFPAGSPKPITAFEEHSLLIIGHSNDLFVFSDPDAGVSNTPEAGFGLMNFDSIEDRLGTGFSAAGMPVNEDGFTRRGQKRYQVISLQTI